MAPGLAEVIAVFEQGKPRIVSLDIFKEFRGENNVHGLPSAPPPSFQGGDEITEIPALDVEKPITEDIARQDRELGKSDHDTGARRDTAGQTDPQEIRQTDRETQITSSCEEGGKGYHPNLDLDGEVDMQGEGNRGQSISASPALKIPENQTYSNLQVQCQPTAQRTR